MVAERPSLPLPVRGFSGCGDAAGLLLEEPNGPSLTVALGCSTFTGLPGIPTCLKLCGVDGGCVTVGRGSQCLEARAPLARPAPRYRGPLTTTVKGVDVLADAVAVRDTALYSCRVGVGCVRVARLTAIAGSVETAIYRPSVVYPCAYAPCRVRVRGGSLELEVPWLCIRGFERKIVVLCRNGTCRLSVSEWGRLDVDGEAYAVEGGGTCSYPFLSRLTVSSLWLNRSTWRATLEVTTALPVAVNAVRAGRALLSIKAWLWNPLGVGANAVLKLRGYRAMRVLAYTPALNAWEELVPLANVVRVPMRRYGLTFIELEARRTLG